MRWSHGLWVLIVLGTILASGGTIRYHYDPNIPCHMVIDANGQISYTGNCGDMTSTGGSNGGNAEGTTTTGNTSANGGTTTTGNSSTTGTTGTDGSNSNTTSSTGTSGTNVGINTDGGGGTPPPPPNLNYDGSISGLGAYVTWTNNNFHLSVNVANKDNSGVTGIPQIDKIKLIFPQGKIITIIPNTDENGNAGAIRPIERDVRFSTTDFSNASIDHDFSIELKVDFTVNIGGIMVPYHDYHLNTFSPVRRDVGYVWATRFDATPIVRDELLYASSAKLIAQSSLYYLPGPPGNGVDPGGMNHQLFGPNTDLLAINQSVVNVVAGIKKATFVIAGTHGAPDRLWSSDLPVNSSQVQYSTSLHANSTSVGATAATIKQATDSKALTPDVHLALLYACETIKDGSLLLKNAFLRQQTSDAAICAFPYLLHYQTLDGSPVSTHASYLLFGLQAGKLLKDAVKNANTLAPPKTLDTVNMGNNPMQIQGDDQVTGRFVYLTPTESLGNRQVWYIVKRGDIIQ